MHHKLISNTFIVDGVSYSYTLTKAQLETAVRHGGTKRSNEYEHGVRHMHWVDNGEFVGQLLPSNSYVTTRVIVKKHHIIVYLPYYISENHTARHIAIFNRDTLQLQEDMIGNGLKVPYVISTENGFTLTTHTEINQDLVKSYSHINKLHSDLSGMSTMLDFA